MAKARMLHTQIATSPSFNNYSLKTQLVYVLIIPQCDDFGCYHGDPEIIKNFVFPKNEWILKKDIEKFLKETRNEIYWYEIEKRQYIQFKNWAKFQNFGAGYHKKSEFPQFLINQEKSKDLSEECRSVQENAEECKRSTSTSTSLILLSSFLQESFLQDYLVSKKQELQILFCFEKLGLRCEKEKAKEIWEDFKNWLAELVLEYPDRDLVRNAKAWSEYWENPPAGKKKPTNLKSSFRTWVAKDYAIKKIAGDDLKNKYSKVKITKA